MSTVSVLIPAYNCERLLGDAVRSIQEQTYSDWELIIINDASTDNTGAVADALAAEDPRIRVIHHTENKFRSGALNSGIDAARGAYIGFLDADDLYFPNKLERQVAYLEEHPEVDGVHGDHERYGMDSKEGHIVTAVTSTDTIREDLKARARGEEVRILHEKYIAGCSVLIRARVFADIRFDPQLRNAEDLDLWLQIFGAGFSFTYLPGVAYRYRLHSNQKSRNPERMRVAGEILARKMASGEYITEKGR